MQLAYDALETIQAQPLEAYVGVGGAHDDVLLNFTRLVVKTPEHTWGIDVKSHLFDNANWTNAQLDHWSLPKTSASLIRPAPVGW